MNRRYEGDSMQLGVTEKGDIILAQGMTMRAGANNILRKNSMYNCIQQPYDRCRSYLWV
jgi:hypothetical protein